jgi:hypothetical protein
LFLTVRRDQHGHVPEARFKVRDDGIIEVEVGLPGGVLDHALNDAVTSRAPKGARHPGLSTYWIDRAERQLALAIENRTTEPFASGNVTYLRTDGRTVIASFDFDEDETTRESIDVVSFVRVLAEWREQVIASGGVSGDHAADVVEDSEPIPLSMGLIFDNRECKVCANGQLAVMSFSASDVLFLECQECMTGYPFGDPDAESFRCEDLFDAYRPASQAQVDGSTGS